MRKPLLIATLLIGARVAFADQPYIPKQGSAVRTQICEAFRRSRPQPNVRFSVRFLLVQGDWALLDALGFHPKEGKTDAGEIAATLHRLDGKWSEVHSWWHDDMAGGDEFRDHGRLKDIPESLCQTWDMKRAKSTEKSGPSF